MENSSKQLHIPVLLHEVLANLPQNFTGPVLDVTLGYAGHSSALANLLPDNAELVGMDKDINALTFAKAKLSGLATKKQLNLRFYQHDFKYLANWQKTQGNWQAQFILADIGVSSPQIDDAERGFSYRLPGPLDMRMDQSKGESAATVLARLNERELSNLIYTYGEERYSRRIAKAIIAYRAKQAISDTQTLTKIVRDAMPKQALKEKQDPARRTFQALRIYVNDELSALSQFLEAALPLLLPDGRLAVISFHSLEDRIVKQQFQTWANPCKCLKDLPCCCGLKPLGKIVTKKALVATELECAKNPRSHSAKLRIFEKF